MIFVLKSVVVNRKENVVTLLVNDLCSEDTTQPAITVLHVSNSKFTLSRRLAPIV